MEVLLFLFFSSHIFFFYAPCAGYFSGMVSYFRCSYAWERYYCISLMLGRMKREVAKIGGKGPRMDLLLLAIDYSKGADMRRMASISTPLSDPNNVLCGVNMIIPRKRRPNSHYMQ